MLHYINNDQPLVENDLVVLDSPLGWMGTADVISSRWATAPPGQGIYNIVLSSLDAAIAVVKPGVTFAEIDEAPAASSKMRVMANFYSPLAPWGLEVHDDGGRSTPRVAIITVEPGVYLGRRLGCRLEDDILVTATGHENLTKMIPRTAEEVEQAFANSN